jgi:hypothetical protein
MIKLFVGNLPSHATSDGLKARFTEFGIVHEEE